MTNRNTLALPARNNNLNSLLGFDELFNSLENLASRKPVSYPPHNIIKLNDDQYRVELSVAGLKRDDIEINYHNRELTVSYSKPEEVEAGADQYLHRGISSRSFKSVFTMADDYYLVENASIEDGILSIDIKHEVPEERKPRKIEIK